MTKLHTGTHVTETETGSHGVIAATRQGNDRDQFTVKFDDHTVGEYPGYRLVKDPSRFTKLITSVRAFLAQRPNTDPAGEKYGYWAGPEHNSKDPRHVGKGMDLY